MIDQRQVRCSTRWRDAAGKNGQRPFPCVALVSLRQSLPRFGPAVEPDDFPDRGSLNPPERGFQGGRPAGEPAPTGRSAISRSEEHTSELQSLMRISYAVFCLKKKKQHKHINDTFIHRSD